MTGPPGDHTMEMQGGSTARALCVSVLAYFNRSGSKGASKLPRRRGITSVVRWNLRPVIFGVEIRHRGRCS